MFFLDNYHWWKIESGDFRKYIYNPLNLLQTPTCITFQYRSRLSSFHLKFYCKLEVQLHSGYIMTVKLINLILFHLNIFHCRPKKTSIGNNQKVHLTIFFKPTGFIHCYYLVVLWLSSFLWSLCPVQYI